jgi:hypothetical protein
VISKFRKRISYANVAATLAVVFAMTGGAYAAKKYVITSTKQIKPSVLKKLEGKNGKNGATGAAGSAGAAGPAGPQGPAGTAGAKGEDGTNGTNSKEGPKGEKGEEGKQGKEGEPWTAGGTLPSGKTETGTWGVRS